MTAAAAPPARPQTALPPLAVALWQAAPAAGDVAANLAALDAAAAEAAAAGAALLVTPEMALTGYAIGAEAVRRLAEPATGPMARAVAALAARHHVAVVWGGPERATDGRIYNAAQLVDADGVPRLHYRKTHLFGALDRSQFAAGDRLGPVAEVPGLGGWRVGLLICYDLEFPEAVRTLAAAGADLLAVPTANMANYDLVPGVLVPARAYESQLAIAYANHCGTEHPPGAEPIRYGGLSVLVGPDGAPIAHAGRGPALCIGTIDGAALAASRAATPYLADRRPALYAEGLQP